jgi:hypothetical protein
MANVYFDQQRAVDPFTTYTSTVVNRLTRMMSEGQDCILKETDLTVIYDGTASIEISTGICFKDNVFIESTAIKTVDMTDSDYYTGAGAWGASGIYYLCVEYVFVRSKPAPIARITILDPSQHGDYPGTKYVFLKAIKIEGQIITALYDADPGDPSNKREYAPIWDELQDHESRITTNEADIIYQSVHNNLTGRDAAAAHPDDSVTNTSTVPGATVKDALDNLGAGEIPANVRPEKHIDQVSELGIIDATGVGLVTVEFPHIIEGILGNLGQELTIKPLLEPSDIDHTFAISTTLSNRIYRYRDITVNAGVTLSVDGSGSTATYGGLGAVFICRNFTLNATGIIDGNGTGAPGGTGVIGIGPGGDGSGFGGGISVADQGGNGGGYGSYGGAGATAVDHKAGVPYGEADMPLFIGSGGSGAGALANGGNGGGIIVIYATGTVTIDGTIRARGATGSTSTSYGGGGGSGGSILIIGKNIAGSGNIQANGGNGGNATNPAGTCKPGGAGSGGRIFLASDSITYSGSLVATGGSGGNASKPLAPDGWDAEGGTIRTGCFSDAKVLGIVSDSTSNPISLAYENISKLRNEENIKVRNSSLAGWVEVVSSYLRTDPIYKTIDCYERDGEWLSLAGGYLYFPNEIGLRISGCGFHWINAGRGTGVATGDYNFQMRLDETTSWDNPIYASSVNRHGKDFYIYALLPVPNAPYVRREPGFILSINSTAPTGYNIYNSRKIGGFHCNCANIGAIPGHPLQGLPAGRIIDPSIWDLSHRPLCSPEGMTYSNKLHLWVDIYLQSGTGNSTESVYNGTITDTRAWNDHIDDLAEVGKRLLREGEFNNIAEGSNELTAIAGAADPVTTGGHSDTAGRRMVSWIGCEDCCGALWQWILGQSYVEFNMGAGGWFGLPGVRGNIYRWNPNGDCKHTLGGHWADGANCGSRCINVFSFTHNTAVNYISTRGCCEPLRDNPSTWVTP